MWFDKKKDKKFLDLQEHLLQLLNVRKGSVSYLPDYGLSDLNEVYQNLPGYMGELVSEVKNLIVSYESRLTNVNIIPYLSDEVDCIIYLKLQATFSDSNVNVYFDTYFMSGGEAKVEWIN